MIICAYVNKSIKLKAIGCIIKAVKPVRERKSRRPNEVFTSTPVQKKKQTAMRSASFFGGGGKARTYDLHDVNVAL